MSPFTFDAGVKPFELRATPMQETHNRLHDIDHRLDRIERRLVDVTESNLALLSGIQQLKGLVQQVIALLSSGMTPDDVAAVVAEIKAKTAVLDAATGSAKAAGPSPPTKPKQP